MLVSEIIGGLHGSQGPNETHLEGLENGSVWAFKRPLRGTSKAFKSFSLFTSL